MTDYDLVEYPATPFAQCHPDRLAALGRLFGVPTEPAEKCRVLETGCGDGLNLIAASMVLPHATLHGIDLSKAAVDRGKQTVRELGLKNVRLQHRDLRTLTARSGRYHCVVAHGLYSWVPADVREHLLDAIKSVLAPNGIAFVSYNVYPGAYLRQMVREQAAMFTGTDIALTREWLRSAPDMVAGSLLYRAAVRDEAADMLRRENSLLFHDDLAKINQPCWFRDFMGHAADHGLQFVAEADLGVTSCPPGTSAHDRVAREQFSDFLTGRRFRQTLLCHDDVTVSPNPDASALNNCFTGGPVDPGLPQQDGTWRYASRTGANFMAETAEDREILDSVAAAWPAYVPVKSFQRHLHPKVLALFAANMIDLRLVPPPVQARPGRRPETSPLARIQAARGMPVTSLHHMEVRITSDSLRCVLALADGSRTRLQLIRDLRKLYPADSPENIGLALVRHLEELSQYGLLLKPRPV